MKPLKETPPRECLFAQRYKEEDGEIFVALYQCEARLLLVTSKERGGDIEVELSRDDAPGLISALQRGMRTPEGERELKLRSAAQIALLGETPRSLRSLSLALLISGIHFKAILASDASEEDKEDVSCIATEILAAFDDGRLKWEEELLVFDGDLRGHELDLLVYRRKE